MTSPLQRAQDFIAIEIAESESGGLKGGEALVDAHNTVMLTLENILGGDSTEYALVIAVSLLAIRIANSRDLIVNDDREARLV